MYHSLIISGKNTWDEWKLIPSPRPYVNLPYPNLDTIEIPGRNGVIDTSEILTGHVNYGNRTGSWEFFVTNDYPEYDWVRIRDNLASYIHGKRHIIILEDDPKWQYEGRLTFTWKTEGDWSRVSIGYDLYPFKRLVDYPEEYLNISVNGEEAVLVKGYDNYEVPEFVVATSDRTGMYVTVNDEFFFLKEGTDINPKIMLGPGEHKLTFHGTGMVSIHYRGGAL